MTPLINSAQDAAMNPSNPPPVAGTAAKIGGYGVLGLFVAWLVIKRASWVAPWFGSRRS